MSKNILGLDLGSNSIGWALLSADKEGKANGIIDIGSRIFHKSVTEKTPTPKNVARRDARLSRRVLQRRARRKKRMLHYLVSLKLLPTELKDDLKPEICLNEIGDPYELRANALFKPLTPYELGRVFLHLVQRRGFLSNRKTLIGDLVDDPDVQEVLHELESQEDESSDKKKEETSFKRDISKLREDIQASNCKTLGEYLFRLPPHSCRRNRARDDVQILRTDRQMYRDELEAIWEKQSRYHPCLTEEIKAQIVTIIFHQRPLKLRADRIGKCSLEPDKNRIAIAKLEYQRFRYLQDINHLKYRSDDQDEAMGKESWCVLNDEARGKLITLFESKPKVTFAKIKKTLGMGKNTQFNLETDNKNLKGNSTASKICSEYSKWDALDPKTQEALVEDLLTIRKKSVLKKRLMGHWFFPPELAVNLSLLEFEPGHGNLSRKAIQKILPYLEEGAIYSEARLKAGYNYESKLSPCADKLPLPPEINNPIVNKALNELKRLINAIIVEYGKPAVIRIEMARDLEMNTKRYKRYIKQQNKNKAANEEAKEKYQEVCEKEPHLGLPEYIGKEDQLKYRLWKEQEYCCIYSGETISLATLFSAEIEIDHILPLSQSLDDSYMNKVVCFASYNRKKGQNTPIDAFCAQSDQWQQIINRIKKCYQTLPGKKDRFLMTEKELEKRDFTSTQLNDTRYITKVAMDYLKVLDAEITTSKGIVTSWVRHHWDLNRILSHADNKDRADHRHHTIDAVVTACLDLSFYQKLVTAAKQFEKQHPELSGRDLYTDPPWPSFKKDVADRIHNIVVSHAVQRKISGALHADTGLGFIQGCKSVSRIPLSKFLSKFDPKNLEDIIDPEIKRLVVDHLARFNNNPKEAFAKGNIVYHKDGCTPIKRVRVSKAKTTREQLEANKVGIKDRTGRVFKWYKFDNIHHVEILRNKRNGKYEPYFVTAMAASCRAKGINTQKQPIVKMDYGEHLEFLMVLHINDLICLKIDGTSKYFRVQKLNKLKKGLTLRLHSAANLKNKDERFENSISVLIDKYQLTKCRFNILGKQMYDKADR